MAGTLFLKGIEKACEQREWLTTVFIWCKQAIIFAQGGFPFRFYFFARSSLVCPVQAIIMRADAWMWDQTFSQSKLVVRKEGEFIEQPLETQQPRAPLTGGNITRCAEGVSSLSVPQEWICPVSRGNRRCRESAFIWKLCPPHEVRGRRHRLEECVQKSFHSRFRKNPGL